MQSQMQQLLPSAQMQCPTSLALLAAQLCKLSCEQALPVSAKQPQQDTGTDASSAENAGKEGDEQNCSNRQGSLPRSSVSPQLRLRARLHLEALKILDWCLIMMATKAAP